MMKTRIDPPSTAHSAKDPDQLIIRHIAREDLPELEWNGEYRHLRRVFEMAFKHSLKGFTKLWVAELPQTGIVGQIFVHLNSTRPELANGSDRAYIFSFRVKPEYRGMSIGTQLLDTAETCMKERHIRFATLNVAKANHKAIHFYHVRGYQITAHEDGRWCFPDENGIWQEVIEPAWRMEKRLDP